MAQLEAFKRLSKTKRRYQNSITFFLLIIVFGFLVAYVPLDKIIKVAENEYLNLILKLASSSVISLLLRVPLFTTDPLATGNSKESEFFRQHYPSKLIVDKYKISSWEATDLWFSFFNSLSEPNNQYHSQWLINFQRSYGCRLILYLSRLLLLASVLSGLVLSYFVIHNMITPNTFQVDIKTIGYFLIIATAYILLKSTNSLPSHKRSEASGCWYKYEEICGILRSILKREVLDKCNTVKEAGELVDKIHKNQSKSM